jgi:hypothetical protein
LGVVAEPGTGFIRATNGTDGFTIDRFNMRQNAATGSSSVPASIQWDELRFGLTWASVTPPAPPAMLTNLKRLGNGAFQFGYTNNGLSYSVYASTNLIQWGSIGAATQSLFGLYQFTDTNATKYPRRFYQLRSP